MLDIDSDGLLKSVRKLLLFLITNNILGREKMGQDSSLGRTFDHKT